MEKPAQLALLAFFGTGMVLHGLADVFVSGYLVELPFISYGIPFVASVVCVSLPMLMGGHQIILRKKAFFL